MIHEWTTYSLHCEKNKDKKSPGWAHIFKKIFEIFYSCADESISQCNLHTQQVSLLLRTPSVLQINAQVKQCDRNWQNSTTLANIWKFLEIYLRFIWFWGKFPTHFCTICMLLGKFSLLKMAKYWKHNLVIWSHWSQITVPNLRRVLSKNSTTGGS